MTIRGRVRASFRPAGASHTLRLEEGATARDGTISYAGSRATEWQRSIRLTVADPALHLHVRASAGEQGLEAPWGTDLLEGAWVYEFNLARDAQAELRIWEMGEAVERSLYFELGDVEIPR